MKYTDKTFKKKFGHGYYENTSLISNSMMTLFDKDPHYYKLVCIDKTIVPKMKKALFIGKAVDLWLTEGKVAFNRIYIHEDIKKNTKAGKTRALEIEAKGKTLLNEADMALVTGLVHRTKAQPIFRQIIKGDEYWLPAITQIILTNEEEDTKGKLDFLQPSRDGKVIRIIDHKTSKDISKRNYYFSVKKYNYDRQMAHYKNLVRHNYPNVKEIKCLHFSVEKDPEFIFHCQLFKFPRYMIEDALGKIYDILADIRKSNFKPQLIKSFDEAVEITDDYEIQT